MQKTIAQNNIKHCNNNNDFLNKTSTSRAKVGPLPGVTRDIGRFKISTNPLMMVSSYYDIFYINIILLYFY